MKIGMILVILKLIYRNSKKEGLNMLHSGGLRKLCSWKCWPKMAIGTSRTIGR